MNKTIWASIACASLLMAGATGCSEETVLAGDEAGYVSLNLDFDPSPLKGRHDARSSSRGEAYSISKEDLTITLARTDGALPPASFTYAEFGDKQTVVTGRYTIEASYGTSGEEGWDLPYYYGSQEITVKNQTATPVSMSVTLANAIVNVSLSDAFKEYMQDYSVSVTTASGHDFNWADDESRQLYVNPGSVMITVDFTKANGQHATAQIDPFTAEARHLYNISVDVEAGEAETLRLTFDDTITDVKEVDIDISDANLPMLAAAPEILTEGFEAGDVISTVSGSAYASPVKATVVARGKIDTAVLNVNSAYLRSQGWPASIDLANAGSYQSLLDRYGVKTLGLTGNKSVFAVIDFTQLISKVLYVDGEDNTSSFSLTVTDAQGKDKTVDLFSINVERLVLEILDGSEIISDGHAVVKVRYNGASSSDISLVAYNDRGTTDVLKVSSVAPGSIDGSYDVSLESSAITLNSNLKIYAVAGSEQSADYMLRVPSLRLMDAETNAFAKSTYATILFTNDDAASRKADIRFEVSTDGGNTYSGVASELDSSTFSARGSRAAERKAVYKLSGLTAGTDYMFRAKLDDEYSATASFTTEVAAQLPDAGFDTWTCEKKGDYQYLWKIADGSVWSTVNELTISTFGSGSGSGGNTRGCAYKATSGTIPANGRSTKSSAHGGNAGITKSGDGHTQGVADLFSDRQHGGNNAALIRTVGWGSGNTAAPLVLFGTPKENAGFNVCNTTTPGELFLGSCINNIPNYGYQFTSRPSLVSFYYHYDVVTPGNGDYGYAEVIVYDVNDNPIAKVETNLYETDSYKLVEMPLTYDATAKNASKISVRFVSSSNSAALEKDTKYWHTPGHNNTSGGEYVGSELYIDDIVLNY